LKVKIKPVGTRVCSVCGAANFDMSSLSTMPSLSEHFVMKKNTSQLVSIVNTKSSHRNTRMTSLF